MLQWTDFNDSDRGETLDWPWESAMISAGLATDGVSSSDAYPPLGVQYVARTDPISKVRRFPLREPADNRVPVLSGVPSECVDLMYPNDHTPFRHFSRLTAASICSLPRIWLPPFQNVPPVLPVSIQYWASKRRKLLFCPHGHQPAGLVS